MAVAAGDETDVVQHFGHAGRFLVYDLEDGRATFRDSRLTGAACGSDGRHDQRLETVVTLIADCNIVLVHEVGPGAVRILQRHDVTPIPVGGGDVDDAVSTFAAAHERAARPQASGATT